MMKLLNKVIYEHKRDKKQTNQTQKNVAKSVAERRRQVALQVIEDRINKETAANGAVTNQ